MFREFHDIEVILVDSLHQDHNVHSESKCLNLLSDSHHKSDQLRLMKHLIEYPICIV